MALVSGLHSILDPTHWESVKQSGEERINSSTINPYTNVIFDSEVSGAQCARLLIVAAPPKLLTSWHDTMLNILADVKAFYDTEVHVWLYSGRAARTQSIARAHELTEPVVWFIPFKGTALQVRCTKASLLCYTVFTFPIHESFAFVDTDLSIFSANV